MFPRLTRLVKLVILASPGSSTDVLVNFLDDAGLPPLAVLVEPPQSRRALLRGRARRLGWGAVLGQVLPLLRRRAGPRLAAIRATHGLRSDPLPPERVTPIASVNAPETVERLRQLAADAVVLSGTRIVRLATMQAAGAPVLNIHAGITPAFRGVHGGYWALWTGQTQDFGATLHLVDPGVDTGPVLHHVRSAPGPADSFVTYPLLQLATALPALAEVLHRLRQGQGLPDPVPVAEPGRQWYHPTLGQYLAALRRGVW
jgi:hypothetical protein